MFGSAPVHEPSLAPGESLGEMCDLPLQTRELADYEVEVVFA